MKRTKAVYSDSQALQIVGVCEDWEVLHHAGPTQHPKPHMGTNITTEMLHNVDSHFSVQYIQHVTAVGLTESEGQRGFEKLRLPQTTEGCHTNVCGHNKRGQTTVKRHGLLDVRLVLDGSRVVDHNTTFSKSRPNQDRVGLT